MWQIVHFLSFMKKSIYLAFALMAIFLWSCDSESEQQTVTGNGVPKTETRESQPFSKVETSGDMTVHYLKGSTPSVKISCDENLLEYIETTIAGDMISVKPKAGVILNSKNVIRVTITSKSLTNIDLLGSGFVSADEMTGQNVDVKVNGSGKLTIGNITASNLNISVSGTANVALGGVMTNITSKIDGSGKMILSGTNTKHNLTIIGTGVAQCYDLKSITTDVVLTGAAKAELSVSKTLSVNAAQGGTVYYKGSPSITENLHGSGLLVNAN